MTNLSLRPRRALAVSACSLTLLLSGCGADSDSGSKGGGGTTLGFVNGADTEFHTCLQKSIEQTAEKQNVKLYTANSHQNPGTELSNIEDMISRNVSALVVQTVNTDALKGDIAKAKAAGIPIFLTSVSSEADDILGAVLVDLTQVGKLDAGWVEKDAGGRSVQVGVVAGAPGAASDLLVDGFTKALPKNAKVVANQPGMFNAAKAQDVAENMIQAHPDLDYAFVANEEMGFAVRKAFDAAGKKDVKIVTVNGTDKGLAAVKDGRFSATVANSAKDTGEIAVKNSVALLREEKTEKIAHTPIRLITKDNTDTAPLYCPADK
ncbi:sugar ABC transporter substrate-binding protein [Streptomyces sp. NPDC059785]|uniref:sugar ABC transporter substrate-binding protein n=1 Tax=unclassified Streptomyces TaxID=2593676 RepID=UPI00364F95F1